MLYVHTQGGCFNGEALWGMLQTNLNWRSDVTPCFDRIDDDGDDDLDDSRSVPDPAICAAFLDMLDAMVSDEHKLTSGLHDGDDDDDDSHDDSYSIDFVDSPMSNSGHSLSVSQRSSERSPVRNEWSGRGGGERSGSYCDFYFYFEGVMTEFFTLLTSILLIIILIATFI